MASALRRRVRLIEEGVRLVSGDTNLAEPKRSRSRSTTLAAKQPPSSSTSRTWNRSGHLSTAVEILGGLEGVAKVAGNLSAAIVGNDLVCSMPNRPPGFGKVLVVPRILAPRSAFNALCRAPSDVVFVI
ncbi:hypothetical protein [Amycolatopsis sp.]|uniref:hypothetical protein n=1 Tax=Amycolatopsis sp. TaxID=37632 RepID=UPI002613DAFB|nr:hypothetical protein [Amycolatopsis sp.]